MDNKRPGVNSYLKYTGLAFQIFGTLAVGAFFGNWLDNKFNTPKPYFTIFIILFLFIGIIYWIIQDTKKLE
ncbi:MAG: AtpZ/AtpI family protein [Saprospiraceae bacterium]